MSSKKYLVILFALPAALLATTVVNGVRTFLSYLDLQEISAPANPAAGYLRFYADSGDSLLHCLDSSGAACLSGGSGGGTLTMSVFKPTNAEPPSSNYATLLLRNVHPLLAFSGTTAQCTNFTGVMPEGASFTNGIDVRLYVAFASATSGTAIFSSAFERINATQDLDADGFATAVLSSGIPANATNGIPTLATIAHSSAEIDSVAAGESYRLQVCRAPGDAGDDITTDAQLVTVEVRQGT